MKKYFFYLACAAIVCTDLNHRDTETQWHTEKDLCSSVTLCLRGLKSLEKPKQEYISMNSSATL